MAHVPCKGLSCDKCWEEFCLKLPGQIKKESELERLVRVANEGRRVMDRLVTDYLDKIEYWDNERFETTAVIDCAKETEGPVRYVIGSELRIKPTAKPKFPELYVGPQEQVTDLSSSRLGHRLGKWLVTVSDDGETVSVGCQQFGRIRLHAALGNLVRGDNGYHRVGPLELRGNRTGVWTSAGTISWDDADRLLAALEAYQKQLEECK